MILKPLFRLSILFLALSPQAFAQTPAPSPPSDKEREARLELERKAVGLLDDAIKDSESFKHLENRVRVKMLAANLLWTHDVARARTLFREAMASLNDLLSNQADDPAEAAKIFEGPRQLRAEMLQLLAQRDPKLAREFLRATRPNTPKPEGATDLSQDFELQSDMNLAMQIAASDPKLAAEIAQESMSKGFPYQLINLVQAIREKDPEVAAKLSAEILAKLNAEKLDSSAEARHVAVSLLRLATDAPEGEAKTDAKASTPLLDQAALRELTDMIAKEALRPTPHSAELLSSLESMMMVVEKYAPARAAALRRKLPQKIEGKEEGAEEAKADDWEKYTPLIEKGSVDELLDAATKAPEPMRSVLYQSAASKLIEKGEHERARQLINEKIQDPDLRKQLLELMEQADALAAVQQGKVEQTRKTLATLRTREERAGLLAQLAMAAAAKGEKKLALELLEEASGMIGQRAKNVGQLTAQLLVARAYAQLDPSRSLTILEPIVDQLNELLGAATILGEFFIEELVKDDEIMLGPVMMFLQLASGEFLTQYAGDLQALARADFARVKALADRFHRDEVKVVVRLLLAESILSPPKQTTQHVSGDRLGLTLNSR